MPETLNAGMSAREYLSSDNSRLSSLRTRSPPLGIWRAWSAISAAIEIMSPRLASFIWGLALIWRPELLGDFPNGTDAKFLTLICLRQWVCSLYRSVFDQCYSHRSSRFTWYCMHIQLKVVAFIFDNLGLVSFKHSYIISFLPMANMVTAFLVLSIYIQLKVVANPFGNFLSML
ncbi:hypothetical protein Cgig2_007181 [Carnegiea gigantea]|uniref:Uncharacterized protein n=1 Tax=Carnegiea gigantea TaxID=171969 RepID=A0A9Q1QHQ0_9CARY|nr:hypothetical protein Cgig2_007181 [Carnegiea gigantea]